MSSTALLLAVVLGAIGMAYLSYGKIRKQVIPMLGGVALMILPYFSTAVSVGIVAVLLVALLSYFVAF
jgi:ABC-type transport system involved in multi-copper enzyme maturation permease subunit